jgi:hypothetical protein
MCEPTTIMLASLAISAAMTAAQHEQARKQASAQEKAVKYGNALETAALSRQYDEQNSVAQENMGDRAVQNLADLGRLHALSAETGANGNTADRITDNQDNLAGKDLVTIQQNTRRQQEQSHAQGLSQQAQAGNMLSNIRRPSALGTGLQIGAAAASAYGTYTDGKRQVADAYERSPGFVGPAGYLRNK